MARILFAWELGGGMGHLARLQPIANELLLQGHRIDIVARNFAITRQLMSEKVAVWQAPLWKTPAKATSRATVRTFAHVLQNVGYSDAQQLALQLRAWRSLLVSMKPDVMVCDSSPTALLAARGLDMRVVAIGTGFHLPPPLYPLPAYRHIGQASDIEPNKTDEDRLSAMINVALSSLGIPAIKYLGEIFDTEPTILTAVEELDHFDGRIAPHYASSFVQFSGDEPTWPTGAGPRIFAYLKPFPLIGELLNDLNQRALPTLIHAPDIPASIQTFYTGDTLRFHSKPIAMAYAAPACDMMISHAGYGLPLDALLAGKPILSFPLFLDQYITARNIDDIGAGAYFAPGESQTLSGALEKALSCNSAAKHFSEKYGGLDRELETERISELIVARLS
jgi:hypothetical protein